jgi:nucleoside-diphosphate-sugar epimerase
MRLLIFGYGFSGRALARRLSANGWDIAATCRADAGAARIAADGALAVHIADNALLAREVERADALLLTAPPGPDGCPALAALGAKLAQAVKTPRWIGYLSTTGVYGDRRGGWVTERSRLAAQSVEAARRVAAERDWREACRAAGRPLAIFRLPGIYGPGRSVFDRLREGRARRITSPDQVFSRVHVDDLASGLAASIARPRPGAIYNLCDDEPAANSQVVAYAAQLLGVEAPPEVTLANAALPASAMRFYAESKRVSNALAKAELGWRPAYPTYREGLSAILADERDRVAP